MQRKSFQNTKTLSNKHSKVFENGREKTKPLMCMQNYFLLQCQKDLFFGITHVNKKKQTIFASINKRKTKQLFLYFSRKYEAHKVVFSTKETNLVGRGYRLSFQKEIFRYFTKKPISNYASNFVYDNAKDRNFWI